MGLFQHRPEEEESPWALPSEPLDHDATDTLDSAPAVDPLTLGLGAETSSIVFPVTPPPPATYTVEDRQPEDDPEA